MLFAQLALQPATPGRRPALGFFREDEGAGSLPLAGARRWGRVDVEYRYAAYSNAPAERVPTAAWRCAGLSARMWAPAASMAGHSETLQPRRRTPRGAADPDLKFALRAVDATVLLGYAIVPAPWSASRAWSG
jgi:hypothetical protein